MFIIRAPRYDPCVALNLISPSLKVPRYTCEDFFFIADIKSVLFCKKGEKMNRVQTVFVKLFAVLATGAMLFLCAFSCKTLQPSGVETSQTGSKTPSEEIVPSDKGAQNEVSLALAAKGVLSDKELTEFFMRNNPNGNRKTVEALAKAYISEAATEGINSDAAFAQMCLETGFLQFGNLVTADMHNYAGLGAIDAEHRGETFASMEQGVRAHIQHLHAYATTDSSLHNPLVDNRYKYVNPRGKATSVMALSGTWAADPNYGIKLSAMLETMQKIKKGA